MPRKVVNGDAIRSIRELAGYSKEALAAQIGISRQALAKIEDGDNGMAPRNLKRAAEALTVPIPSLTQAAFTAAEVSTRLGIPFSEVGRLVDVGALRTINNHIPETAIEEYIARELPGREPVAS